MKMDDETLATIVSSEIADSVSFIDSDIGPQRAKAVDYYFGRPFGDEEDGRSQVVSRDVHDTIQALLPSLMRIFFGSQNVVEFVPEGQEDVKTAEKATEYVNYVVSQDNDGFEIFYAAIKNSLRERVGFVKYWWDESVTVSTKRYTGLDADAATKLQEELGGAEKVEMLESSQDDEGLWSVKLKIKCKVNRVRIDALPPEEFLISRDGRTIDAARFVAHRCMKTVSDLVAMGLDRELVEEQSQDGDDLGSVEERLARNPYSDDWSAGSGGDKSQRLVLYVEAYPLVDFDGDGIAELRKVCTIGPGYTVVSNEEWDGRPFADFQCDPEPHTFFGQSVADKTMDIQRIKSAVLRGGLDSLTNSIFPRTVVIEGDGYMEDAMNTENGAVLRSRKGIGYVPLVTPFVGQQAFPYLTYMDEVREGRTGMSKVSMGLDAESLQNTTATAAEGQFTRSQDRIDLIARIMASGMRRLFRGILHLLVENQTEGRMVKLSSAWEDVDPRAWRADMDVICTLGLGGGSDAEKLRLMMLVKESQEQIMLTAGVDNPLVTPKQYHKTLTDIVQLGGNRNPDAYFTDPDGEEAQQRMAAKAQQPPQVDPKVLEVQQKGQLAQQSAQAGMDLENAKAGHAAELQSQQAQADNELAMARIQSEGEMKRWQIEQEMDLKREQLQAELTLKRELAYAELDLKREQIAMGAATDMHGIDVDADVASSVHTGGEPG